MNAIQPYNASTLSKVKIEMLSAICKELRIPDFAVVMGMADDGYPILLDVSISGAQRNVVIWDKVVGQGLNILKTAIEFITRYKKQKSFRTEFVVLSNSSLEWEGLDKNSMGVWDKNACIAVVPFKDHVAEQVMRALAGWCYERRVVREPVILFIDGLENIQNMSKVSQENFEYVLHYGNKRGIFVIATVQSENRESVMNWLSGFQAEVFGRTELRWFEIYEKRDLVVFYAPYTEI